LLLPLLLVCGCDRMNRVRECKQMSGLVNPRLGQIESLAQKGKAADYRAAATTYAALAKELRLGAQGPGTGKALASEYAGVLDSVAPAVSAYANALDTQDAHALDEARRSLDRLSKHERGLVARIDAYCLSP
jgi:hypothetical protein